MKDANLVEQNNGDTTSLALADFCAQILEQAFNVAPFDIRTCRMRENAFEGALTLALHLNMVLRGGTNAQ